jgi:hypothetical protein
MGKIYGCSICANGYVRVTGYTPLLCLNSIYIKNTMYNNLPTTLTVYANCINFTYTTKLVCIRCIAGYVPDSTNFVCQVLANYTN